MDTRTGEIHYATLEGIKEKEKEIGRKLVPLTDEQAKTFQPLSKRKRLWLLKHGTCPCGSKKSFKKCCWRKYT